MPIYALRGEILGRVALLKAAPVFKWKRKETKSRKF